MLGFSFEVVLAVSCIVSAFVGYSLGEYFTKRDYKKIIKRTNQTKNEKDDK